MAKLLTMLDSGKLDDLKGKGLDDIPLDENETLLSENEDDEEVDEDEVLPQGVAEELQSTSFLKSTD